MNCSRHFLNVRLPWEHHSWAPRVTFEEHVATQETNMWGRVMYLESVRCQKEEVCTVCGKTRRNRSCVCDTSRADACAIRLEWLERQRHARE